MLGDAGRELVGDPDRLVFFLVLGSWLAYFNVRTRRFQNVVLGPAAVAAVALTASAHDELLVECLIAAGGTFVLLFGLEVVWPALVGMGTVKAAAVLALFLGYTSVVALGLAGVAGVIFALRVRRDPARTAPPGPAMFVAALLAVIAARLA